VDDRYLPILEDALKNHRKKEGFEAALSRAIRKTGGKYEDYIELVTELREFAYYQKLDLVSAAKKVLSIAEEQRKRENEQESGVGEPYTKV
jgi:hypothetical protein